MIKQYLLSPGPTPIPNEVALAMSETIERLSLTKFSRKHAKVSRLSLVRTAMF